MLSRRSLFGLAGAYVMAPVRAQQRWPDKPVMLVVPYAPGSAPDSITRILAEQFHARFGQPFVVDNKVGAGGNVGVAAVARSTPNGYTFVAAPVGIFAINQFLQDRIPFDAARDLAPVTPIYEVPNVLVVRADHPARSVSEFVDWARGRADPISFGSPGVGNSAHLFGDLLRSKARFSASHVPFQSSPQVITSMLQGDVAFAIDIQFSYLPFIHQKKLRALAVTGTSRWPLLPDVPTMDELGFTGFDLVTWVSLAAPAGTPPVAIRELADAQVALAQDAALQQRFLSLGVRIAGSRPEALVERIARERPRWGALVKASGARTG